MRLQHSFFYLRRVALAFGLVVVLAGCSQSAEPPPPTRTPAPTFTPTIQGVTDAVDTNALATVQAAQQAQAAQPVAQAPAAVPATDGSQPVVQPIVESTSVFSDIVQTQPTAPEVATAAPTPAPANPEVTITEIVNVRGGPGLTYNIVGAANPGQTFPVIGKSPDGQWWQITYNGQPGWVFGELVTAKNAENVAVAQNIPVAPPPPTAAPVVVEPPTAVPAPVDPGPTATPEPAKSNYKFNITAVSKCDRQPAGNWFEGKTYVGGVPQSGYKVVFSYAADAPPITEPVISGPHPGYPGWDQGFYSHIIRNTDPIVGHMVRLGRR